MNALAITYVALLVLLFGIAVGRDGEGATRAELGVLLVLLAVGLVLAIVVLV